MLTLAMLLTPPCYAKKTSVNEVNSHNKPRQSYLALEKLWRTQCGWLRLCTTVAIGMTITNFWNCFRHGVKREHYDKFIGIREFLERLAQDCYDAFHDYEAL